MLILDEVFRGCSGVWHMATLSSDATPVMLGWARRRSGLSIEQVAKVEHLREAEIAEWENGHGSPSFAVLRRLSKRYKHPLMVFYLPEPPMDFTVVRDFRRLPDHVSSEYSPELSLAIRSARERQVWASEYLTDFGEEPNDLVGLVSLPADINYVASILRERLSVSIDEQLGCATEAEAFAIWKARAEELGVLVFQASKVEVSEMRGCAFADRIAPAVLINIKDAYAARSFTLVHEIAHLLLGESAITATAAPPTDEIERFCNAVAAETLVPADDFVTRVPHLWRSNDNDVVAQLATLYRVSRLVILLKLVETKLADRNYLNEKWVAFLSQPPRDTSSKPNIPQHTKSMARNGKLFSRLAISAYQSGEIHGGALSELLGMKLVHLPKMMEVLRSSRVQSSITES